MPGTINGTGTWLCRAGYDTGEGWDDGVECFTVLWLPIVPLRAVHFVDTSSSEYVAHPIRSSGRLVTQVFVRRWSYAALAVSGILAVIFGADASRGGVQALAAVGAAAVLLACGVVLQVHWRKQAGRERDLRLLLGTHHLGTSDPATWTDEDAARMPSSEALFGAPSYWNATDRFTWAGQWSRACWAARLCARKEDPDAGEEKTGALLARDQVRAALADLRVNAERREDLVGGSPFEASA